MAIVVGGAEQYVPTALLETSGETNGDEFQAPRVAVLRSLVNEMASQTSTAEKESLQWVYQTKLRLEARSKKQKAH